MKKFFLTIVVACLALSASAVDLPKQGFGFQVGFARPILRLNSPSAIYPKDSLVNTVSLNGLKVGLIYDASYIAGFGSSMGINYTFATNKGGWVSSGGIAEYPRSRNTILYHQVELFVDWQYKFEVAKETYLTLFTGPTIQYGIAFNTRKETQLLPNSDISSETYNRYGKERPNEDLQNLNVTWGLGAAFQYQRYFIRGGYDFGLLNPYRNKTFENQDRYTRGRLDQWSIKVGMYLWYSE